MDTKANQSDFADALYLRIQNDLVDSFDEELELEVADRVLAGRAPGARSGDGEAKLERHRYFRELFGLQRELVKMQDWVSDTKYRLVVLFEGRDAAGKGGVIKRITQRL